MGKENSLSGMTTSSDTQLVSVTTESQRVLLKPLPRGVAKPPDFVELVPRTVGIGELAYIWEEFDPADGAMALDFETTGLNPERGDVPVTIGLADSRGGIAIDVRDNKLLATAVLEHLHERNIPLIAHNFTFDGAFAARTLTASGVTNFAPFWYWRQLNWVGCTLLLAKLFSSETKGLHYDLKSLQLELLQWDTRGDVELDAWLIAQGFTEKRDKKLVAKKSEMHRAPPEILGKYCALDCVSTWQLYKLVFLPLMARFPAVEQIIPAWMTHGKHLIAAQLTGVPLDVPKLRTLDSLLLKEAEEAEAEFRSVSAIAAGIAEYNRLKVQVELDTKPEQTHKPLPELPPEPPRLTKNGTDSPRWLKWNEKREVLANAQPEETAEFKRWKKRVEKVQKADHFSITSRDKLSWLAYEYLGKPVLSYTDSGKPALDDDAKLMMGPDFKALIRWSEINKMQTTYSSSLLEHQVDGRYHPHFQVPGTLTGRLSGAGGVNAQNQVKDLRFLDCWIAGPGKKLILADIASLEPVVLAEVSRDEKLLLLYGPNAQPHCVYLFYGVHTPMYGPALRAAGYLPEYVTTEIVKDCKKRFKAERSILKECALAFQYGAGWRRVQAQLRMQGVEVDDEVAQGLHHTYHNMFAGRIKFERQQQRVLAKQGWVLNAIGRPVCVAQVDEKDVLNRIAQSGGHDILVLASQILADLLAEEGIEYWPHIYDMHDCLQIIVKDEDAERTCELMRDPFHKRLHALLNPDGKTLCLPKWDPNAVDTWAQDKEEAPGQLAAARKQLADFAAANGTQHEEKQNADT